ncbi:type I secretion protein ATPase [Octadecabacter ascidiaceicola]|nr:type I secretion protein ATPase [Octadecabacter ascidiaceicola]
MDKMTEMVAHMVGIFHTTLEEQRMREAYDKFKALAAADPENDPLEAMGINFKTKYSLEGFTPGLRYADSVHNNPGDDIASPFFSGANYPILKLPPIVSGPDQDFPIFAISAEGRATLTLEPASSVVVVTFQEAYLTDNDMILLGDGETVFTDPAEFLAQLQTYQTIAAAVAAPVSSEMIVPGENATADAITLHDKMSVAEVSSITGVAATMLHGAEAVGLHINGEAVEKIPTLDELMPAFKADDVEETETTDDGADEDYEWPDPFEGLTPGYSDADLFDTDDGHAVVAGANLLLNEVFINSSWLDAPVFSVMGDVVNLNIISQVNVLVDHDYGTFGELIDSTAMNAATLTATVTTPVPEQGEEVAGEAENLGLPSNWAVTRIDGDLIAINQINQYSFVTDDDCAELIFGSTNTYIGMGDNTVINLTDLAELGYGYDLIMIGGSMISVNWISQVNVMIDNDTVTVSGNAPADISGSDNLLFNSAMINSVGVDSYGEMQDNFAAASNDFANGANSIDESVAHDSVFEGTEILRVLYIEGDLTTVNWIEQTNVLGDSDQVHLALENLESTTGASATVTTGSNAIINSATINEFGVDSQVAVNGDVYDDALLYQANLVDTDADPLGVAMPALANEAVAFLADDMMGSDIAPEDTAIVATAPESTASPDVMQTMLA